MFIHAKKWKSIYVNFPLAYGLAPANLYHFLVQRLRWSRGASQIFRKHNPLFLKGLTFMQRLSYLTSLAHFFEGFTRLVYYSLPALFILTGVSPIKVIEITVPVILGYVLLNYICLSIISRGSLSFFYDEVYSMIRFFTYFIGNLALFQTKKFKFAVTPKDNRERIKWFMIIGPVSVFCINVAALISKGFLIHYGEMISLTFAICMIFCVYFSFIALEAMRICFSYSKIHTSSIHDFVFLEVSISDSTFKDSEICLIQTWNDTVAKFLSHHSYKEKSSLSFSIKGQNEVIRSIKARILQKSVFFSINRKRKIYEYTAVFEDLSEKDRLTLIDYIFHKGLKRQYSNIEDMGDTKFFPVLVDHNKEMFTVAGMVDKNEVIVRYYTHLPKGSKLKLTMPFKGSYFLNVSEVLDLDGNIYLKGSIDKKIAFSNIFGMKSSFLPKRSNRILKLSLMIVLLFFAANIIRKLVEVRSYLFDMLSIGHMNEETLPTSNVVKRYGNLQLIGTQLCDENKNPIQLKGVSSHGLQWFPFKRRKTMKNAVKFFNIDIIRIAMYVEAFKHGGFWNGYISQPDYMMAKANSMIQETIDNGIYAILSWHIHSDPTLFTNDARDFFHKMSAKWGGYPNVIFEICNEPEGNIPWRKIRNYAIGDPNNPDDGIIDVIRKYDPDKYPNIIIVGTPFWSQQVDKALEAPITEYNNIMYALHFYASEHKEDVRMHAQRALNGGLGIFVSEWGTCNYKANGPSDFKSSNIWVDWMEKNKMSWINWSLCTKDERASLLRPFSSIAGPWTESDLTVSGKYIYKLLKNK
jgi:hypothetical protein